MKSRATLLMPWRPDDLAAGGRRGAQERRAGVHRKRHNRQTRIDLSHIDAHLLRMVGLNPADFRDAAEGKRSCLLFRPFRDPGND
jgi:uncharacterized protein YjiS (DUF1127 family)